MPVIYNEHFGSILDMIKIKIDLFEKYMFIYNNLNFYLI
jgi:hypothetical protein